MKFFISKEIGNTGRLTLYFCGIPFFRTPKVTIKEVGSGRLKYFFGKVPFLVISKAISNKVLFELNEHASECTLVLSWFSDEESRLAYQRELLYLSLISQGVRDEFFQLCGLTMPQEEWDVANEKAKKMYKNGELPALSTNLPPNHANHGILWYIYATTYIFEQYRYKDFVAVREGDVMLDCGGCFGETAIWAVKNGASKAYIFEPSPDNIPHVKANIQKYGKNEKLVLVPYAVGAEAGEISFVMDQDNPAGSHIDGIDGTHGSPDEKSKVTILKIRLDDWCTENNVVPDFIKMDIEGAEVEAIKGAAHIIAKHKPRLAICLYHRTSDMWTIPAMLKEICPEYRFWCRKNAPHGEFVLYCAI